MQGENNARKITNWTCVISGSLSAILYSVTGYMSYLSDAQDCREKSNMTNTTITNNSTSSDTAKQACLEYETLMQFSTAFATIAALVAFLTFFLVERSCKPHCLSGFFSRASNHDGFESLPQEDPITDEDRETSCAQEDRPGLSH